MQSGYERFQIPSEFVDYRRRLIIHSDLDTMRIQSGSVFSELKKYGALDNIMDFEIGNIAVKVAYLADEHFSLAEVIANLKPSFAMLNFEADARMGPAALAVNDRFYPQQWALHNIEAAAAWTRVAALPLNAVTVAIVDSGIQRNHEDLPNARISGLRIIPPSTDGFADDTGHGTMIAGVIGAVADNTRGIAGEARNVDILAIKITDERTPPTALAAVSGIGFALLNGAQVINMSWHVLADSPLLGLVIGLACLQCVVVAAAGNYGSNNSEIPTLPASYGFPDMIVAMASDRHDDKCWFSNYGDTVDLAAPGMRVQSTGLYYINPRYPDHSGTSVAAAYLSGAAALLLAIDHWTPHEIHDHLNASADRFRTLQGLCRSNGRLNLRRAVCGPIRIVAPVGGHPLQHGTQLTVQWASEYAPSIVQNVQISFINKANGNILGQFGGVAIGLGHQQVTVPSQVTAQAFVRVRSVEKNLYEDSAVFAIV